MLEWALANLVVVGSFFIIVLAGVAAIHALLYKEEVRAAIAWVGLIALVPLLGSVLYYLIGINRIHRRAVALRREADSSLLPRRRGGLSSDAVAERVGRIEAAELAHLIGNITSWPLYEGNRVRPLVNGDEAYPAMLEAIGRAERSIVLMTYIFDHDRVGQRFVDALASAQTRGVEVRVLIDAVGARYSRPRAHRLLRDRGVPAALFLPTFSTRLPSFNLRNHRKVMVVDGKIGFTGGMNIRESFVLEETPESPGMDLHFELEGPVVRHLQQVFAEDWEFTTLEPLRGEAWFPAIHPAGNAIARGIADGP
ncbi:MAG TPA: phospholipase D-like domain-containing protein, partial [Vicinamibacteria bacterium]|nr:phospholipase D-like domain-containing protein [Vicinamibacteria bacterium]